MKRTVLRIAIAFMALALLALLIYSVERTSWLFGLFEVWPIAAQAAAIVVESAAIALIVSAGALDVLDKDARAWANRALVIVLSIGALANLAAGYLRGGDRTFALFQQSGTGVGYWAAYAVASALWLVTNLSIPGLIWSLSKLLERLVTVYMLLPAEQSAQPHRVALGAVAYAKPSIDRASIPIEAFDGSTLGISGISEDSIQPIADRACPNCNRQLDASRYGAAKRWGYCKDCKEV